jgi:hypothetical protein
MNEQPRSTTQEGTAGKNVTIVGRDYKKTTNFNFVFFVVGLTALGGLAWGIYTGVISSPANNQQQAQPSKPAS